MFGLDISMVVVIFLTMAVRWCRYKYESHLVERLHLLQSHGIPNHSKAFKETVSLLSYPVILCALIVVSSFIRMVVGMISFWFEVMVAFLFGSIGFFVALSVAIHLLSLGTARRASMRKGSKWLVNRNTPRSELVGCINGIFWVPFLIDISWYHTYGCLRNYLLKNDNVIFEKTTAVYILWYVPSYVTFGLDISMVVVIFLTMAVRWCRYKYESHLVERLHLLQSHGIPNHSKAFKETVSLLSYPVILCALIVVSSFIRMVVGMISFWFEVMVAFLFGSIGFFVALSVAIHLLSLGTARRASMRKGSKRLVNRNTPRSELAGCINEGEDYTAAGSMTATDLTEFEPPTESEVDKHRVFT